MYSVKFNGFRTLEQAETFIDWYEGQGEQDSGMWLEEHANVTSAYVNNYIPYRIIDNTIEVELKIVEK